MQKATLVYLIYQPDQEPPRVYLGKKNSKYVAGWLNTAGGKVDPGEDVSASAIRELKDEWGVEAYESTLRQIAVIRFLFPSAGEQDLECHVFLTTQWRGEPRGTREIETPQLFSVSALPLDQLPPADRLWLPNALRGQFVNMSIELNEDFTPIRVLEE